MYAHITNLIDGFERGRVTRRQLIAGLTGLVGAAAAARAAPSDRTFTATEINHIALSVTDVTRSREFYQKHLGMTLRSDNTPHSIFLNCGSDFLALFRADTPEMNHYCYTVEGYDAADAVTRLEAAGLKPRRRSNRVYFDDPDGLEVQVSAPNRRDP